MSLLADLLKEFPALAVAKERLALIEDRLRVAESENEILKAVNAELKIRIAAYEKADPFYEHKGVLWKVFDGVADTIAYCPECKLAMSAFPPGDDEMLICSKCGFTAPFPPSQIGAIAKDLEIALLTA